LEIHVQAFNEDNFALALSHKKYTTSEAIKAKNQFKYLLQYLGPHGGLNAQTFVVEEEYVSKDYLQDYASYYAYCFENYPKFCKRIHFFNTSVTNEMLKKFILDKLDSPFNFNEHYLGFIVVKPIPTTVIGLTILRNSNVNSEVLSPNFWGIRSYTVHFFGRKLKIDSLAFQEQDSVVAACATTAIWSMLQGVAKDFNTTMKSPSQITKDADTLSSDGSRLFPNKGLSIGQICQAIHNSGLAPELKQPDTSGREFLSVSYIKRVLNAYSPLKIPIILVIDPDGKDEGLHAITVAGFQQGTPEAVNPKPKISWHADNINIIYAHDDQWGPFVQVTFNNEIDLRTKWVEKTPHLSTKVTNIIVPVYPKVRIAYEDIEAIVLGIDGILTQFFDSKIKHDLVWDLKIELSETIKSARREYVIDEQLKYKLLTEHKPKFIWVATCYIGNFKIFELTFDATDVNNGMVGLDMLCFLPKEPRNELIEFLELSKEEYESKRSKRSIAYYHFILNGMKAYKEAPVPHP